jgi:hypothetical protein
LLRLERRCSVGARRVYEIYPAHGIFESVTTFDHCVGPFAALGPSSCVTELYRDAILLNCGSPLGSREDGRPPRNNSGPGKVQLLPAIVSCPCASWRRSKQLAVNAAQQDCVPDSSDHSEGWRLTEKVELSGGPSVFC